MKKNEIITTTYELEDGYFVEIQENYEGKQHIKMLEFWLGHEDYGVKVFMFGVPKDSCDNQSTTNFITCTTLVSNYIELFRNKYMDED